MAIDFAAAEPGTKEIVHEQLYCALTGVPSAPRKPTGRRRW